MNLSTFASNANSNASIVQTSTGYTSSTIQNNSPNNFTFVSTNSSLVSPSLYINNSALPSIGIAPPTPSYIPYTSINNFTAQTSVNSSTPQYNSQYTPPLLPNTIPILGQGQSINLSGFLNATDLATLGCDQFGNC